nr:reverse transcriptase zinc-binding domain-containing protein [Tanacetum cinerariifolium]
MEFTTEQKGYCKRTQIKSNNNIWSILRRLVFGVVVYDIWQERNARVFGKDARKAEVLFKEIMETLKLKLMNMMVKESKEVNSVELIWDIKLHRVNEVAKQS